MSFGSLRVPQPDFSATSFNTPRMRAASNIGGGGAPAGTPAAAVAASSGAFQNREPEFDRIFSGGVREFIDKRLHHEGDAIAAWSAHRTGRNSRSHHRRAKRNVGHEANREFVRRDPGRGSKFIAFPETDEMILPGD